ncbi:DUF2147 domain-containing protein [Sphaerotilus sp.]|uniref:DUF2147 domain-containing protein n=1 Tax=Sphaerotilus sp. TaxID=2093942 RepID=UPI002ACD8BA2|nr:DUF2147 domain-containing protein [Sphaerotilus sp.]MDZ7855103.1 DUF2147 domain-containing protein [Sphaerotilus sp.]
MKNTLIALALAGASLAAAAQSTPAGLWKTIDDDGKTEKSLVRITDNAGTFSAKVEKVFDATKQDARCEKCSDDRKDQPVLGMTIVKGVRANLDDKVLWDGGEILDPNNGKTYKVRMKPVDGGKQLEVRGYIGAPLLGRTQTWVRVE